MIRVRKPRAPAKLQSGTSLTEQNCAAFDTNSTDYLVGKKKFDFKRGIYGHKSVKDALINAQHGKCCFCEGLFKAHAYGDVEHYRPKSSVRQARKAKALYPGYFWLAYSWDNLFWSCQICNRTNKKDFFPLIDPAKRVRSHKGDLAIEEPLLLNPSAPEDPRNHIKFRGNLAFGVTKRGRTTIEIVDLNRTDLAEERLDHLKKLRGLLDIVRLCERNMEPDDAELVHNASRQLALAVQPTAKFSAMAADFLASTSYTEASEEVTD